MSATVFLIRHGATAYHETGHAARDDPLSGLGRAQADALRPQIAKLLDVSVVLVSPLDRALETAVRAFADRPDVRFVVIPALREFNMRQKAESVLFARHTGVPLGVLKARYDSPGSVDGPWPHRAGIEWPADSGDADEWWEPHGSFCDSDDEHTVLRRIQRVAAAAVWSRASAEAAAGDRCVAVVAHENVFRALTGWPRFPTAQVVPVTWQPPLAGHALHVVTPLAAHDFVGRAAQPCTAASRVGRGRSAAPEAAVTPSDSPRPCASEVAGPLPEYASVSLPPLPRPPLRCTLVLACTTDQRTLERRLGAAFAAAHPDEVILISASPAASLQCLLLVEAALDGRGGREGLTSGDGVRVIVDYYASDTVASAERTLVRLVGLSPPLLEPDMGPSPWRVRLVTDDWHMPRALAIFWGRIGQPSGKRAPQITPAPVRCSAAQIDCLPDALLLDARHAAQRWFCADDTSDEMLGRIIEAGAADCLLAVGRNYRAWARRWSARIAPTLDSAAHAALRAECAALRDALLSVGSASGSVDAINATRAEVWARLLRASFAPASTAVKAPSTPPALVSRGPFPLAILAIDADGITALHLAAASGCDKLCKDLVYWFGAAAYARDASGRTAADAAAAAGWQDLADSLELISIAQSESDTVA